MNPFRADLHCHTTCSDGFFSPAELVHLAHKNQLSGLSITDHDTIEAYRMIIPLCAQLGISLLTGVEFSSVFLENSIHILGYGFHHQNEEILNFCARHAERRIERNQAILELLAKRGMPIDEEEIKAILPSPTQECRRTIGRPHIAMAMVQKGYVSSIQEAFKRFIGEDKPCYSQGISFTVEETIETIHKSKGIAVIAHPHLIPNNAILKALIEMPFDGIECYYGTFAQEENKRWLQIAKQKEWLVTGGSDFHGTTKPNINLGSSWISEEAFNAIQQRLNSL